MLIAENVEDVFGKIPAPSVISQYGNGAEGINNLLNMGVELLFAVATIIFIFMILFGALQWIMSGGEKEKLKAAQDRILHAVIGITLLALSFLILTVIGYILGIDGLKFYNISNPGPTKINWESGKRPPNTGFQP